MSSLLVWLIKTYRKIPFAPKGACRFVPSCSEYCQEAISRHGTIKGLWLCLVRILKCNPMLTKQLTHNPVR